MFKGPGKVTWPDLVYLRSSGCEESPAKPWLGHGAAHHLQPLLPSPGILEESEKQNKMEPVGLGKTAAKSPAMSKLCISQRF